VQRSDDRRGECAVAANDTSEEAPDELATVIEPKVEGDPVHELGAGHVLMSEV